jgi:hypothetical protein
LSSFRGFFFGGGDGDAEEDEEEEESSDDSSFFFGFLCFFSFLCFLSFPIYEKKEITPLITQVEFNSNSWEPHLPVECSVTCVYMQIADFIKKISFC